MPGLPPNGIVALANRYEGADPATVAEISVGDLRVAAMAVCRAGLGAMLPPREDTDKLARERLAAFRREARNEVFERFNMGADMADASPFWSDAERKMLRLAISIAREYFDHRRQAEVDQDEAAAILTALTHPRETEHAAVDEDTSVVRLNEPATHPREEIGEETAAVRELRNLRAGVEQSRWHAIPGGRAKRILVAESAIERIDAALSPAPSTIAGEDAR